MHDSRAEAMETRRFLDARATAGLRRMMAATVLDYVLLAFCAGPVPAVLFALAPAALGCAARKRRNPALALSILAFAAVQLVLTGMLIARLGAVPGLVVAAISTGLAVRAATAAIDVRDPLLDPAQAAGR